MTALYEVAPIGVDVDVPPVDPLRYQTPTNPVGDASADELLTVKLRYKSPDGDRRRLMTARVHNRPSQLGVNLGFSSAVAARR